MRLAFFSPLPPAATGIADYSADLLAVLSEGHDIDAFHDQESVDPALLPRRCGLHLAADLPRPAPRATLRPRHLPDGQRPRPLLPLRPPLPGARVCSSCTISFSITRERRTSSKPSPVRAWRLDPGDAAAREAAQPWLEAWREELSYTYPDRGERLFQAQLNTVGDLLAYAYPMVRLPVEASRAVAVHNGYVAEAVKQEVPDAEVVQVPMLTVGAGGRALRDRRPEAAPGLRGPPRRRRDLRPAHSGEADRDAGPGPHTGLRLEPRPSPAARRPHP